MSDSPGRVVPRAVLLPRLKPIRGVAGNAETKEVADMKDVAAAIAATIVLGLVACSTPAPNTTHLATLIREPEYISAVGMAGTLEVTESGCWGFGGIPGLFPEGTTIKPDGSGISFSNGASVDLGAQVETSGYTIDPATVEAVIPPECATEEMLLLADIDNPRG